MAEVCGLRKYSETLCRQRLVKFLGFLLFCNIIPFNEGMLWFLLGSSGGGAIGNYQEYFITHQKRLQWRGNNGI